MCPPVRLVTVHPALVHLPLGIAALAVMAFCWAATRRSERWTFVADVALWACTLGALLASAFGFVSFFTLRWPGGLRPWPQLHLAFGSASASLLLALSVVRARARQRGHTSTGWGSAALMLVVGAVVAFTGWVGGELLVFRDGMAVAAAGDGALAPAHSSRALPEPQTGDVLSVMGQVRGAFAEIETELTEAIANGYPPTLARQVDAHAARLQQLAAWLEQQQGSDFQHFASQLSRHVAELRSEAAAGKLRPMLAAAGSIEQTCAACHERLRWNEQE
jgi:uncharacterized membrane protein